MSAGDIELPVLGIRVRFTTRSDEVVAIVDESFGGWRGLDAALVGDDDPLHVHIEVGGDVAPADGRILVHHRFPDDGHFLVQSTHCLGVADLAHGEALVTVHPTLVAQRENFRETVLEALTFSMLSNRDRHPIHAAAVARDGHAVLLAGASGAGKSTLAHLAHASGITVMGDDHVWIQLEPTFRVWGTPGHARLAVDDGPTSPRTPFPKDVKQRVRLEGARNDRSAYVAERATVCILDRGESAGLERVDADAIVAALTDRVDEGFDRFPERHPRVVASLASGGGWQLTLSRDSTDALPFLETMLRNG